MTIRIAGIDFKISPMNAEPDFDDLADYIDERTRKSVLIALVAAALCALGSSGFAWIAYGLTQDYSILEENRDGRMLMAICGGLTFFMMAKYFGGSGCSSRM